MGGIGATCIMLCHFMFYVAQAVFIGWMALLGLLILASLGTILYVDSFTAMFENLSDINIGELRNRFIDIAKSVMPIVIAICAVLFVIGIIVTMKLSKPHERKKRVTAYVIMAIIIAFAAVMFYIGTNVLAYYAGL